MLCIGLPTADLGKAHSLKKASKAVAEVSFCPIRHVRFARFISFVSLNIISHLGSNQGFIHLIWKLVMSDFSNVFTTVPFLMLPFC